MFWGMPALPPVPSVLRTALKGSAGGGELWLTRFYSQYPGAAPSGSQLATFNNGVISAFASRISPFMTANKTLTAVETTDLSTPSSAQLETTAALAGSEPGPNLPLMACVVGSYGINRRYRGGHPRGYWPMGAEGDLATSGEWAPASVAAFTTQLGEFFNDVHAIIWGVSEITTHVNVSYYSGFDVVIDPITGRARNVPKLRSPGPIVDTVVSVNARAIVGTQRRRNEF
jgi:hypothetical protein